MGQGVVAVARVDEGLEERRLRVVDGDGDPGDERQEGAHRPVDLADPPAQRPVGVERLQRVVVFRFGHFAFAREGDMTETEHHDALQALNGEGSLRARIREIHWAVRTFMPFVARIAVAIYDPKTTFLKTFVHSSDGDDPLPHYQAPLGEVPSLARLLRRSTRASSSTAHVRGRGERHSRRLGRSGFAASYTMPIFSNGAFLGFVFFNSREPDVFTETALAQLDIFGHLVSLLVVQELAAVRTLSAALESARHIVNAREARDGQPSRPDVALRPPGRPRARRAATTSTTSTSSASRPTRRCTTSGRSASPTRSCSSRTASPTRRWT